MCRVCETSNRDLDSLGSTTGTFKRHLYNTFFFLCNHVDNLYYNSIYIRLDCIEYLFRGLTFYYFRFLIITEFYLFILSLIYRLTFSSFIIRPHIVCWSHHAPMPRRALAPLLYILLLFLFLPFPLFITVIWLKNYFFFYSFCIYKIIIYHCLVYLLYCSPPCRLNSWGIWNNKNN